MSTRIEKEFYFQSAVRFEGKFYLNFYDVKLSMLVETESIREQNIAMERIEYFLNHILENSVFVSSNEQSAIEAYEKAGIRVCVTPEDPYDQIVAMIILLKLNSIIENKLYITDMLLGSKLSEGVKFTVVPEIASNLFQGDHWWNSPTTNISPKGKKRKDKIVKLFDGADWHEIGLSWKEKNKQSVETVFVLDTEK